MRVFNCGIGFCANYMLNEFIVARKYSIKILNVLTFSSQRSVIIVLIVNECFLNLRLLSGLSFCLGLGSRLIALLICIIFP